MAIGQDLPQRPTIARDLDHLAQLFPLLLFVAVKAARFPALLAFSIASRSLRAISAEVRACSISLDPGSYS